MSTEIKVLHASCCGNNSPIKKHLEKVATRYNIDIDVEELSDLKETMVYGTTTFPSLVINGKVYDYKKYTTDELLASIL